MHLQNCINVHSLWFLVHSFQSCSYGMGIVKIDVSWENIYHKLNENSSTEESEPKQTGKNKKKYSIILIYVFLLND